MIRKTMLVRAALLAGACAAPAAAALAQDVPAAPAAPPESAPLDDGLIVVTGSIRQAQEAAIETKREAVNFVDVASADSVGRFPDENTAAALARLPGVAVQRDQGQARYIQVRGAPNRWTSVSIDGIPQIGVDEGGESRAYRFDAVPAVLLQQLVVNKSLTPELTAEAITANVDLQTYSPLSGDGFEITGDAGYGFMGLGDGEQRQASLRLSYATDTWGIAAGASHYLRKQITDNREYGYDDEGLTDIDFRNYQLTRQNNGAFAAVEFAPGDDLTIFAKGIYTEFKDRERRNAYQFELADAESGTRGLDGDDMVGVPVSAAYNDGKYLNSNYIVSAGFAYETADGFGLDGALGFTRTENSTDLPLVQGATRGLASPSLTYDRSDPRFPVVTLYETIENDAGELVRGPALGAFDQTSFDPMRAVLIPIVQDVVSDAYTAKLDGWKEFGDWTVKAGMLGSIREIAGNNIGIGGAVPLGPLGFDIDGYVTQDPWQTKFPLGFGVLYNDNERMNRDVQDLLAENGIDPWEMVLPTAFYYQTENLLAGYALGQWEMDRVLLTAGARVEYYELENSGTALVGAVPTPLSNTQDFLDVFPSVNAKFDLTDDLVFRLSGQRGVSRPGYAAIRVGASISDTDETIGGGNPALLPEYTWGLDGSLEYYFPGNGLVSVAGFYRWVDNVLYQSQRPVGSDVFDSDGIDRSGYLLTSTFNGSKGKLYGVEFNIEHQLDFLPGPLSGFGVQGNLTLLDGDFEALQAGGALVRQAFPGLSDTVINASLFYEKYGFSARVSYQWRSAYLDTLGGFGAGEYRAGYENLDVTLRYAVNENLTVFADLANLTDETYVAYQGTPDFPSEVEQIGARYLFGIRFNY